MALLLQTSDRLLLQNSSLLLLQTDGATTSLEITQQPIDADVAENSEVTFTVAAVGTGTLTYQWYTADDGQPIPGETSSSYTLTATRQEDGDQFYVIVSDDVGSVQSVTATLTINASPWVTEVVSTASVSTDWVLVQVEFDLAGGNLTQRINTVVDGFDDTLDAGTSVAVPFDSIRLGANSDGAPSEYLQGGAAEYLIVCDDNTVDTRQRIEGWMAWKRGLAGNLPDDHPYKNEPPTISGGT